MREDYAMQVDGPHGPAASLVGRECRVYRTRRVLESTQELCDFKARKTVIWEMIKLAAMAPSTLDIGKLISEYEDIGGGN